MHLTQLIISSVDWPPLLGSGISEISPNLFSQYVNFCLCYCCQNSNQSTMNKTCCFWAANDSSQQTTHLMDWGAGGAFSSPAGSLFIFKNFQKKKFLEWYCFCCPHQSMVIKPAFFLPLSAQILFNQCNVTGLRGSGCTGGCRWNRLVFALYCLGYNMIYGI